jgi:hypothetical protein
MRTWVLRTKAIFELTIKEPDLINITFVVWDTILVCEFFEGSLGDIYGSGLQWVLKPKEVAKVTHCKLCNM